MKVLLIGSSQARYVQHSLRSKLSAAKVTDTDVICMPGGLINQVRDRLLQLFLRQYFAIFIVVGGNDFFTKQGAVRSKPKQVTSDLCQLIDTATQAAPHAQIICSAILPRCHSTTNTAYHKTTNSAYAVNKSTNTRAVQHPQLWQSRRWANTEYFNSDCVHLNQAGVEVWSDNMVAALQIPTTRQPTQVHPQARRLTTLLRHQALQYNLPIDSQGYVPIPAILHHLRITYPELREIVQTDTKDRFSLTDKCIRAEQGHTIPSVTIDYRPLDTNQYPRAFHGTYVKNIKSIYVSGLNPCSRTHVHMAPSLTGSKSGMRGDCTAVIVVDTVAASKDGIKLVMSGNGVILSRDTIPSKYFVNCIYM